MAEGMRSRNIALTWAEGVVHDLQIPDIDRPYMIAVLVEAALMEEPIKPLNIAVNPDGTRYMITIKGYQQLLDLEEWVVIFKGAERHNHLSRVRHLYVQFPPGEGAYMVIEMEMGNWHEAHSGAERTHRRTLLKKRTE